MIIIGILLAVILGMNIAVFWSMLSLFGYVVEQLENGEKQLEDIEKKIGWIKERVGA